MCAFHAKIFTNAHSFVYHVFSIHKCVRALCSTFFGCLWIVCTLAHLLVSIRALCSAIPFSGHVPDTHSSVIHSLSFPLDFSIFTAVLNAHIYLEHLQMLRLVQLPYHIGILWIWWWDRCECVLSVCLPCKRPCSKEYGMRSIRVCVQGQIGSRPKCNESENWIAN